jgi:tetratricopeptide (TPR) repeat protein
MDKPSGGRRDRRSSGGAQLGKMLPFKRPSGPAQTAQTSAGCLDEEADARARAAVSYQRAYAAEEAGDVESAKAEYWRAIASDPGMADAYVNVGRLLHEDGRPEQAAALYAAAVALRADDVIAHFNLGVALEDLGNSEEAIAAYQRAIALRPRNGDAHYNVARLYEMLGRSQEALRHLQSYRRLTGRRAR